MSKYTTGELAKLCGVSVRTVQYYDTRGILIPSELSEGGRRLFSDNDLRKLRIICYLRDLGLSIDSISKLLSETNTESVISLLLEQQEAALESEIEERQLQLKKVAELKSSLKSMDHVSFDSIGDIAYIMTNRRRLRNLRLMMVLIAIPLGILQWSSVILWITKGIWWPFLIWAVTIIPYVIIFTRWYFKKMAYICPQCHTIFQPSVKEGLFANHTPKTRKLSCPSCGHRGFCVEIAAPYDNILKGNES